MKGSDGCESPMYDTSEQSAIVHSASVSSSVPVLVFVRQRFVQAHSNMLYARWLCKHIICIVCRMIFGCINALYM